MKKVMVYALVFDTETTGLPKNMKGLIHDSENWPYIIQLGWVFIDLDNKEPVETCSKIIKLKNNKKIPQASTEIHGITNEMMEKHGIDINDAINPFLEKLEKATYLIAHNLDFDWKIMSVEFYRNGYYKDINIRNHNIIQYCTMKYGGDLYRFRSKKTGRIVKKWPKLEELHTLLFNEELNNDALHNALADSIVCLRCFYKMMWKIDVLTERKSLVNICTAFKLKGKC